MKLIYGIPSPYSRKARMAIIEKGLEEKIVMVACNPFEDPETVRAANALGKVPALILDDGAALFDSPVICEYVDTLSAEHSLIPAQAPDRWTVLRMQALCDGILDAVYNIAMEHRRDEQECSASWIRTWAGTAKRGLDVLEEQVGTLNDSFDMRAIGIVSVLEYTDIRAADVIDWRLGRPNLVSWHDSIKERPSVVATKPG